MHFALVFRRLARSPGFTVTALATLALCLGANLTIFAVVDAVLVRGLPFPEADRLVAVINRYPGAGVDRSAASVTNYFERRDTIPAFAPVSLVQDGNVILGDAGSPNRTPTARVTPEFFQTLGVSLAMGQMFTDAELAYGTDEVAILTDAFWRSYFNADPDVLGRTFLNDGLAIRVIGVLPRDFRFLSSPARFFRPLSHAPEDRQPDARHNNSAFMIARLAPGASLAEAQAQLDALNEQQSSEVVRAVGFGTTVRPLHADHVREVRPMLVLLQCGALFLALIGGVNLANLLLIRASDRVKEVAVRQALGAGRRHIARDALLETVLLACGGGGLGLLLGAFGVELLGALGAGQLPLGATIAFDGRVALVSLLAAFVVGALLAVPVVVFNLHTRLAAGLQVESRSGTAGRTTQRVRHGFIVTQIATAFMLLAGAGLFSLSLQRLLATPAGFQPDNVLTGRLALPWKNYRDAEARRAFVTRLLPAIGALPGVQQVAINTNLPFAGVTNDTAISIEGRETGPDRSLRAHYVSSVSSDYWKLMRIPLLRGRLLEEADEHREQQVCVIDQAFANYYWPGENPLGRRVARGPAFVENGAMTIVGVVAGVKQTGLAETEGHGAIYIPYAAFPANFFALVVRTSLPPASIVSAVQKTILQLDPELPIDDLRPMTTRIDDSLITRRAPTIVAGIFAGVALVLTMIGTYGVLAYAVTQRRREIGVRMALGALPRQVLAQFLRLGARLLLVGLALGVPLTILAGWLTRSMLFGVGAFHSGIAALAGGVMCAVVFLAVFLPARRAARVDPVTALRAE